MTTTAPSFVFVVDAGAGRDGCRAAAAELRAAGAEVWSPSDLPERGPLAVARRGVADTTAALAAASAVAVVGDGPLPTLALIARSRGVPCFRVALARVA